MGQGSDIGAFLKAARLRLDPTQVGLARSPYRLQYGLRREEVAALAGLSTGAYANIEDGRITALSAQQLGSISYALRLSAEDQDTLRSLNASLQRQNGLSDDNGEDPTDRSGVIEAVRSLRDAAALISQDWSIHTANDALKHLLVRHEPYASDPENLFALLTRDLLDDVYEAEGVGPLVSRYKWDVTVGAAAPDNDDAQSEHVHQSSLLKRLWEDTLPQAIGTGLVLVDEGEPQTSVVRWLLSGLDRVPSLRLFIISR